MPSHGKPGAAAYIDCHVFKSLSGGNAEVKRHAMELAVARTICCSSFAHSLPAG